MRATGQFSSDVQSCSLSIRRWYAVQQLCDTAGERWQVEAQQLQLDQPVRPFNTIGLGHLRGNSHELARHHLCPFNHVPGADKRVLESCVQDVVRPLQLYNWSIERFVTQQ